MRNPSRSPCGNADLALRAAPALFAVSAFFTATALSLPAARADTSLPDEGPDPPHRDELRAPADTRCAGDDPAELRRAVAHYCAAPKHGARVARGCRVLLRQLRGCASFYLEKDHDAADAWVEEPGRSEYLWHVALRRVAASWQVVQLAREEEDGC